MYDNLVEMDKIGSANFYWSLPSKAANTIQEKLKEYSTNLTKTEEQVEILSA